jgi:hypothetical protein
VTGLARCDPSVHFPLKKRQSRVKGQGEAYTRDNRNKERRVARVGQLDWLRAKI